jgi:hypothetical protein
MARGLWEGGRRLPYFFTYTADEYGATDGDVKQREWVLCPQCALEHVGDHLLAPHYTTLRSVMCCRCCIVMGPINQAEMEARDE